MPDSFFSIVVSGAIAMSLALGTLWLARRAGLSDVQREVREERSILVATLRTRVDHLEDENRRLTADIEWLKRENEQLRAEVARLQRHIVAKEMAADAKH